MAGKGERDREFEEGKRSGNSEGRQNCPWRLLWDVRDIDFKGRRKLMPGGISGRDTSHYCMRWKDYGHHG
jgi:hypothetical protein